MATIGAEVNDDLKREFRVKAAQQDRSMSEVLRELVEDYAENSR